MNTDKKEREEQVLSFIEQLAKDLGLTPIKIKVSELGSLDKLSEDKENLEKNYQNWDALNVVSEASKREKLEQDKLATQRYVADMNLRTQLLKDKAKEDGVKHSSGGVIATGKVSDQITYYHVYFRNTGISPIRITEKMHQSLMENASRSNSYEELISGVDGSEMLTIRVSEILYIKKV